MRERFITMLKAGGSDYPYDLYKKAGFDMATPAPYQALVARMNHLMDEIEHFFEVYKKLEPDKHSNVRGWEGAGAAAAEIEACRERHLAEG